MSSSFISDSTSVDVSDADSSSSYIPKPLITFLFDQPSKLVCEICKEAELRLGNGNERTYAHDTVPAILPCAHVMCLRCAVQHFDTQDSNTGGNRNRGRRSCPFCRMSMEYVFCDHPLDPKPLNTTSIFHLPLTIPEGGKIPDNCMDCRAMTAGSNNMTLAEVLRPGYMTAKANYERTKSYQAKVILDNQVKFLENTFKAVSRRYVEDMMEW